MPSSVVRRAAHYLQAQIRWRPIEIVFWLATLLPFVVFAELSRAGEPDRHHRAVRALARSHPRLCRHRVARPRRLLRLRRLHGGPDRQVGLGRAADRPAARRRRRRPARLCHELHHRALPPPRADHDHARAGPPAARGGQQRQLADRRRRRPAGRAHVAAVRRVRVRSLRLRSPMPIRWSCCSWCSWSRGG